MLDANMTVEIENIVNRTLMQSVDGINSTISNNLNIFFGIITVIIMIIGYSIYDRRKIKEEIRENIMADISRKFQEEKDFIEKSIEGNFNKYIKRKLNIYRTLFYEEEFLRNLINYDLNKILSSEIKVNGSSNLNTVFSTHSERLFIIAELTSGEPNRIVKSLKKLKTGTYEKIIKLKSVRDYLAFLEKNNDDLEVSNQLDEINLSNSSKE